MFSVFLDHFSPYMLRQGFLVNLELTNSISIGSQVVQEIPLTLPSKHWDYKQDVSTTRDCVGTGDENFELEFICGVYCVVSALSIEPSSQILCNIILSQYIFHIFPI